MDSAPKELEIAITQELIRKSEEFIQVHKCPISTFIEDLFGDFLEGETPINCSLGSVHVKCPDGLHRYRLHPSFLKTDYETVMESGEPYIVKAYLDY